MITGTTRDWQSCFGDLSHRRAGCPQRTSILYENARLPQLPYRDHRRERLALRRVRLRRHGASNRNQASATAGVEVDRYTLNYTAPFATTRGHRPARDAANLYARPSCNGLVRTTGFHSLARRAAPSMQPRSPTTPTATSTSRTDFNDNKACYALRPRRRNLEIDRAEGLLSAESCATALARRPTVPTCAGRRPLGTRRSACRRRSPSRRPAAARRRTSATTAAAT